MSVSNEQLLQAIFANTRGGLAALDRDFTILKINATLETEHGDLAPIVGKKCHEVLHRSAIPCDNCPSRLVLETGIPQQCVVQRHDANGRVYWVEIDSLPIRNDAGDVTGIVERVRDFTGAIRVEEELRRSEMRYRTLAEAAGDMIFIIGPDARVQYVNSFAARAFRRPPNEVVGRALSEIFPPEEAALRRAKIQNVLSTGEPYYAEQCVTFPSGAAWLGTWLVPLRNDAGQVEAVLGASRDITSRRKAEEEVRTANAGLSEANERLECLDKLKNQFLASVSHELRTPMATVIGASESLAVEKAGPLTDRQRWLLEIITRNSLRLGRLINNLLDISQVEAGSFSLRRAAIDLRNPVSFSVESMRPLAEHSGVALILEKPAAAVSASVDHDRIVQLTTNLVDNAIRFASSTVIVRIAYDAGIALVTVEDDGPGISEENLARLFTPFVRIDDPGRKSHVGLGLSISRAIAEAHGGSIEAASREPAGSVFRFRLPLEAP
jgi:two-component system CheB/CheR fusion protein